MRRFWIIWGLALGTAWGLWVGLVLRPGGPSSSALILRTLVIGLSGLAIGLMLYLAALSFMAWWRDHRAKFELSRASLLLGVCLMVSLITELVWHAPEVPVTWRSLLYTLGGLLVVIGGMGMAINWNDRHDRVPHRPRIRRRVSNADADRRHERKGESA